MLAERQWGVVAWRQLTDCGLGKATVSRWVSAGRLHRIHPGVYAVGHRELRDEGWLAAALLYAGPGSALSHATAAWWWEIRESRPSRLDISTPGRSTSLRAVRLHHPRALDRVWHRRLPATAPARTLLDLAPRLAPADLRRAVAETLYRRLATTEDIARVLTRGRPGGAALRAALEQHLPQIARTRSELENRFLALCEKSGIPIPEVNVRIEGFIVDALWRAHCVVVELDGHATHARVAAVERDRERELTLRAGGWTVLRYTWRQVTRKPRQVVADLRLALGLLQDHS